MVLTLSCELYEDRYDFLNLASTICDTEKSSISIYHYNWFDIKSFNLLFFNLRIPDVAIQFFFNSFLQISII